jgi:CrcB protein
MFKAALIFFGAGCGGLLRYWLGGVVQSWYGPSFPLGTLVVNVSGCLAIGFLATALTGSSLISPAVRAGILIGVLGGYTTFSSFGLETLALVKDGEWLRAGLNIILSVALGLAGVWLGAACATKLYGSGTP